MRSVSPKLSCIMLAVWTWPSATLGPVRAYPHARNDDVLAKPLGSFAVKEVSMIDALLHLGQQENVPLGIEYVDLEALEKPISISLQGTTVGEALRAILGHGKGFTWQVRDGVVNISHKGVASGPKNLLDRILPKYSIEGGTLEEGSMALRMVLELQLHPQTRGFCGDTPGPSMHKITGPLRMRNVTVRQVLNRLVSDKSIAAWVVQAPPGRLEQIPSYGLWRILEYESPPRRYADLLRNTILGWTPPASTPGPEQ